MKLVSQTVSRWSGAAARPLAMLALVSLPVPVRGQGRAPSSAGVTAFVHVGVIAMEDTNQVLEDQTVVVRGRRIVAFGPAARIAVPAGARRIDGHGKYLIPGLADMHAHVGMDTFLESVGYKPPTPQQARRNVERDLFFLVANGVTTVRSVNYLKPDPFVLEARARAAAGQLWSPQIYASGQWRTDEKKSVIQNLVAYQAAGYDFIKLHEGFHENGAALDSLLTAAHLLGLPVMGHIGEVHDSLMQALTTHYASIEHLTGYPGGNTSNGSVTADTVRLPELIAATVRAGVWNCPTQALYELWDTDPTTWPEAQFFTLTNLAYPSANPFGQMASIADTPTVRWAKLRHRIIKGLQDAGAGLLLGTDSPLLVPGFGVHRELQALVRSGLTPYQALATGTRNVAAYFGKLRDEGTIAVGKRADLVLLTGNPLEDIHHTEHPAGVMVNGRWLARATIDRRLAELKPHWR